MTVYCKVRGTANVTRLIQSVFDWKQVVVAAYSASFMRWLASLIVKLTNRPLGCQDNTSMDVTDLPEAE